MAELPSGTVTFLFTDVEGSTQLQHRLGDRYGDVISEHRRLLRQAFMQHGGSEVDTQGDAFLFAFPSARGAVEGAVAGARSLEDHPWPRGVKVRVRMGLHTGEPSVGDEGYHGLDVVRGARICSAAHGGQILISESTRAQLDAPVDGVRTVDLGDHMLKDFEQRERLHQLVVDGLPDDFPPLRTVKPDDWFETRVKRFEESIKEQVLRSMEEGAATGTVKVPKGAIKLGVAGAAVGLTVAFLSLAFVAAVIVGLVFLVRALV
jgi:class 3 adenylate cyclase